MLKVYRTYQVIEPGQWKQCVEICHEGHILGFVDRERSAEADIVRTRTISGEIRDGECIDWLLQHAA